MVKTSHLRLVSMAASLILAAMSAAAGVCDHWAHRMRIGFPTPLNGPLTNFPALLLISNNLNNAGFRYADCRSPGGGDLRFSDASQQTNLDFEIECWDTNGTSVVWVRLPLLQSTNDFIFAYWGQAVDPPACTTNGAVWSDDFLGVWHMSDAASPATDATPNRNSASQSGGVLFGETGTAGLATRYHGVQHLDAGQPASLADLASSPATFSAWVKTAAHGAIMGRTDNDSRAGWVFGLDDARRPKFTMIMSVEDCRYVGDLGIPADTWTSVAIVYNGNGTASDITPYVNGIPVTGRATGGGTSQDSDRGQTFYIGNATFTDGMNPYSGTLDEVRISARMRSPNWMRAAYLNMASNADFCVCAPGWPIESYPASEVTVPSATCNGRLNLTNDWPATVRLYWGLSDGGTTNAWDHSLAFDSQTPPGYLSTNLTLSTPGTYYYRYAISNQNGVVWSPATVSFSAFVVTVAASDPLASKEGPDTGRFLIGRPSTLTQGTLPVFYTLSGSAVNGIEYAPLSGVATIPDGAPDAEIIVTPLDDGVIDGDASVILTLSAGDYLIGTPDSATVIIAEQQVVPRYTVNTFTTNGTFVMPSDGYVSALVVGGGGAGGPTWNQGSDGTPGTGGGGGGGGYNGTGFNGGDGGSGIVIVRYSLTPGIGNLSASKSPSPRPR